MAGNWRNSSLHIYIVQYIKHDNLIDPTESWFSPMVPTHFHLILIFSVGFREVPDQILQILVIHMTW
jgi:hypothetical protein